MAPPIILTDLARSLRGQLPRVIEASRERGIGWESIARDIAARYGVSVDGRTVRSWYEIHRHRNGTK